MGGVKQTMCKRASRYFLPIFGALFISAAGATQASAGVSPVWASIGVLGGVTGPDGDLGKYQWDPEAQTHWGVQAFVGLGRIALGLRGSTTGNKQSLEVPGTPAFSADVRLRSAEALLRLTALNVAGVELYGFGGGGRLRIEYAPDHWNVQIPGTNEVLAVDLNPIDGWIGTAGVGLRRGIFAGWGVGVEVDHHRFSLDTAHRLGDEVVTSEESFGEWTARAELSWSLARF